MDGVGDNGVLDRRRVELPTRVVAFALPQLYKKT
jgi:hypothetical protein